MSDFIVSTSQKTTPDIEICELTASITDIGVEIFAKSPIIAEFILSKQVGEHRGGDYVSIFKNLVFFSIPGRYAQEIGGSTIYSDMFFNNNRGDGGRQMEPNMLWLRTKGLEKGITITFPQPAHVPADLIEYLNRSMEKVRVFYMKFVRKAVIKSILIERLNG